jgi:hypothetical protein
METSLLAKFDTLPFSQFSRFGSEICHKTQTRTYKLIQVNISWVVCERIAVKIFESTRITRKIYFHK